MSPIGFWWVLGLTTATFAVLFFIFLCMFGSYIGWCPCCPSWMQLFPEAYYSELLSKVKKFLKAFIILLSPFIVLANLFTLASTLLLMPIFIPAYMIKDDELFSFFKIDWGLTYLVYWAFRYTVLFFFKNFIFKNFIMPLFAFLSLPIMILDSCISIPIAYCIDSSNVTQLSKKSLKILVVLVVTLVMIFPVTFIILLHVIFTQLLTFSITLIMFPILVPTHLITGDRFFVSVKTNSPLWLLLETIYDSSKDTSSIETIRSSVETVTRICECAICYNEMNKDGRHKQG